jgi:formylglycine-generating enzyme required for sulfatase activity
MSRKDDLEKSIHEFEPEMILIPAGEFLMGSDPKKDKDALDREQPQHSLYLPDYYIARTPVTNAQYAAFAQTREEQWTQPKGEEDHPVINVSWYDAIEYCQWLSEVTGKSYYLPSEAEWEKAARGTDGRIYPWGDEWDESRCNTWKGGKGGTTPVGAYPQGVSPYGCLDMAGNVWEWTRSLWGRDWEKPKFKYPYDPQDGRENLEASGEFRVVRGGSWRFSRNFARCAFRFWYGPDGRGSILGFRLCASPIS